MRLNRGRKFHRWQATVTNGRLLSLLLILSLPVVAQQGSVQSELSAASITLDESVTLSVIAIGVEGELDTAALNQKFDVVGRSSSRQVSSIIGSNNQPTTNSVISWTLELMPRETGVFTVPAVSVGGVSSQLLSLTVTDIPAGARRDVFVEATVDTRTPWVQSQVLMTVRVFQGIEIVDGGLSDPVGKDIQVQRIGKDVYSNETRDGRQYSVTERRFALFPQKSGTLVVDPVILSVSVPAVRSQSRGIFSSTRKLTRRSDGLTLDVQARPPAGMAWWLPASVVTLESSWAGGKAEARVDQPLTRTVAMRGSGVLDSQLPDISIPAIDGVSLYAEEPVRTMHIDARGLVAEQTIKWALIPHREGELVLPAVKIEWFNTDTGRVETALLPEESISVGPSLNAAGAPVADSNNADDALLGADPGSNEVETSSADGSAEDPDTNLAALSADDSITRSDGSIETTDMVIPAASGAIVGSENSRLAAGAEALMVRIAALQSSSYTWRAIALLLLSLWMISIAFYWWRSRRPGRHGDAVITGAVAVGQRGLGSIRKRANTTIRTLAPLSAVEKACMGTDPGAVRDALLEWAARQWPGQAPQTLTALAQMLDDGVARQLVQALDASLYSRALNASANSALMSRLKALPQRLSESPDSEIQTAPGNGRTCTTKPAGKRGRGLPDL